MDLKTLYDIQSSGGGVTQPEIIQALVAECYECLNETNWKWWKNYNPNYVSTDKIRLEVADIFIFAIILAKSTGMTYDDLVDVIADKTEYNRLRADHKNQGVE